MDLAEAVSAPVLMCVLGAGRVVSGRKTCMRAWIWPKLWATCTKVVQRHHCAWWMLKGVTVSVAEAASALICLEHCVSGGREI